MSTFESSFDKVFSREEVSVPGMRMPLSRGMNNTSYKVVKISGKDETIKHINDLGLIVGSEIIVVSGGGSNIVCNIKNARIGLGKELANRITVVEI